jgi:hypothetical protein
MPSLARVTPSEQPAFSPLVLSDRLLTLAEDADRAGYRLAAEHLLFLAEDVLDQPQKLYA